MNAARIVLIVVALAAAGLTVFLIRNYLADQVPPPQQQPVATIASIHVLVAERDLPAGTILNPEAFRWQPWPKKAINENYVQRKDGTDPIKELTGAAVKRIITAGDPIIRQKLVSPDTPGFLAGVLPPGTRAISIPISGPDAASGFILPGNLVDLVLTQQHGVTLTSGAQASRLVSETIMEKLRILAIDQSVDDSGAQARIGSTVTVGVSPKEAEIITVAKRMGTLSLLLRSLTEPETTMASDGTMKKTPARAIPYTQNTEVSKFLVMEKSIRPRYMVTTRDIPAGSLLRDLDIGWDILDQGAPSEGLILAGTPIAPLRGAYIKTPIKKGGAIKEGDVIRPREHGFIIAALQPGMRAVSIIISNLTAVSGYISPGDHVDIMLTQTVGGGGADSGIAQLITRKFTETVFRDMRLLAIDRRVDQATGRPSAGGTATFEVTPRQAEELALAQTMGQMSLVLRSVPAADAPEAPFRLPEGERLPYTTDISFSRGLINLLVYGTKSEPELVRARQSRRGAGIGIMTPQRRIIRTAPRIAAGAEAPASLGPALPPSSRTPRPTGVAPGLTAELPAVPKPQPRALPEEPPSTGKEIAPESEVALEPETVEPPEPSIIRIYRGGGLSTVQVE